MRYKSCSARGRGHRFSHMSESPAIRRDLWVATIDHTSGRLYCWNGVAAEALDPPAPEGALLLPTVTAGQLAEWKSEFSRRAAATVGTYGRRQLKLWTEGTLPAFGLVPRVRAEWNTFLRRRVGDILVQWFQSHDLPIPDDLIVSSAPLSAKQLEQEETRALREAVLACVRLMSHRELMELKVPASALLKFSAALGQQRERTCAAGSYRVERTAADPPAVGEATG